MVPGEGPLVEVLPNGQTVDEVMQDIAGGESQSLGWCGMVGWWDGELAKRQNHNGVLATFFYKWKTLTHTPSITLLRNVT